MAVCLSRMDTHILGFLLSLILSASHVWTFTITNRQDGRIGLTRALTEILHRQQKFGSNSDQHMKGRLLSSENILNWLLSSPYNDDQNSYGKYDDLFKDIDSLSDNAEYFNNAHQNKFPVEPTNRKQEEITDTSHVRGSRFEIGVNSNGQIKHSLANQKVYQNEVQKKSNFHDRLKTETVSHVDDELSLNTLTKEEFGALMKAVEKLRKQAKKFEKNAIEIPEAEVTLVEGIERKEKSGRMSRGVSKEGLRFRNDLDKTLELDRFGIPAESYSKFGEVQDLEKQVLSQIFSEEDKKMRKLGEDMLDEIWENKKLDDDFINANRAARSSHKDYVEEIGETGNLGEDFVNKIKEVGKLGEDYIYKKEKKRNLDEDFKDTVRDNRRVYGEFIENVDDIKNNYYGVRNEVEEEDLHDIPQAEIEKDINRAIKEDIRDSNDEKEWKFQTLKRRNPTPKGSAKRAVAMMSARIKDLFPDGGGSDDSYLHLMKFMERIRQLEEEVDKLKLLTQLGEVENDVLTDALNEASMGQREDSVTDLEVEYLQQVVRIEEALQDIRSRGNKHGAEKAINTVHHLRRKRGPGFQSGDGPIMATIHSHMSSRSSTNGKRATKDDLRRLLGQTYLIKDQNDSETAGE